MKKLSSVLLALVLSGAALSAALYDGKTLSLTETVVTTNTFSDVIDLTESSSVAIHVSFTGQPLHKTTALFGITNAPTGTNGENVTLFLAGTTSKYTFTNTVTTALHVLAAATAAESTTNLYVKLLANYRGDELGVSYATATRLQLQTPYGESFTVTNSVVLGTNIITTNAIAGNLTLKCSNSLDRVTWAAAPAYDFTMAYSSTAAVSFRTNYTALGPVGWYTYTVENSATNGANPQSFKFIYRTKRGL